LALCFISHDRYFLESVATRIIEINQIFPRGFFETTGGYGQFMEHKSLFLEGQEATLASMANKLRTETAWLQRGAQARSTKQQARIKSATQLKSFLESSLQRTRTLDVAFQFSSSARKSKKLIDVVSVAKSFASRCLFRDLTFTLGPGLRLGLLGPNGSGKSTLLKIIQRKLEPDQGQVEHAEKLRIVYYDQQRAQLPTDMTLRRALSPDSDSVVFQNRSLHVASYCKMFGFRTDQLDTNVDRLSGGEKARLLIARMLLIPADVLILDEPTNDLDIDTLSMLEESLISFSGAVVLVTHDRYMMDRVCNGLLGFMGDASGVFYADYAQYVLGVAARREDAKGAASLTKNPNADKPNAAPRTSKKLSYNEQREWDAMEARILEAETALEEANALVQSTDIASNAGKLADACLSAQKAQTLVDTLYARWTELENKQKD